MSVEQEHMISRPEMKGPETKYFNTDIKNILSSISNIIKPNDEVIDTSIDKDKELPEGETWNQYCTISCSSGVRRKIEYWSGYRSFDNYEEMCDDMRDTARSINNNSTIYTDENNFKQSVLFGGCLAENVVDLRTRNVNVKKRNSNFPWETTNFPWSFTNISTPWKYFPLSKGETLAIIILSPFFISMIVEGESFDPFEMIFPPVLGVPSNKNTL